jgi:hypothetical protein
MVVRLRSFPADSAGVVSGRAVLQALSRVTAYAFTLVTDQYPPFRLGR